MDECGGLEEGLPGRLNLKKALMGWVVGRIKVDGDAAGASLQPLRMALDHAVGQGFAQTVQFSRPEGVFKARQGWLRSQIAACNRIAVEQRLVNGVGRQAGRVVGIRIAAGNREHALR